MKQTLQRAGAALVAFAIAVLTLPAPSSAAETGDQARAIALLSQDCSTAAEVAQASPSPEVSAEPTASPTASPSPSPTPVPYVGRPAAPLGPQVLVPAPMATAGAPTAPPLPSPSPSPSGSPPPVPIAPVTVPPSSTPAPLPTVSAGPVLPASPTPAASATPQPEETLGPNDYAILGDKLTGRNVPGAPQDLSGHVNILYADGVLVGDHAHYDGSRYIDVTGNTFIRNRTADTIFYADAVRFDSTTQQATLINGRGESTQGVERGKLHFKATTMVTQRSGVTHGEHAYLTTCENPRGGYHLESKTLDVYPGDKAVAKSVVLFLGALAVFYLPVVVISLRQDRSDQRRNPGFIPIIGYSQSEGFYVKARIGFQPSNYYYGYYRVEEYTKIGLGLGYVGTIRRRDGRRQTDVDFFRQNNRIAGGSQSNLRLADQENFSQATRGQFALNYTGNYGPLVSLPPQYDFSAAVAHGNQRGDAQNYSFRRESTGSQSQTNDYGFTDHRAFSTRLQNDLTVSYTNNSFSGNASNTLHYATLTHFSSNAFDYNLAIDRTDASTQSNVQKEPELEIRPHSTLFPRLKAIPITGDFTLGQYQDPVADLATSRGEAKVTVGPGLAHVLGSDFNATLTLQQDAYGTGDLKAQIGQQATLTTPMFGHLLNTINYTDSHVNGPFAEPFKSIDVLGNGTKQATDTLRIFNGDVYSLSLTGTTFFNRQAQAIGYQFTSRPSPRSTLLLGGSFAPGPGNGFDRTSVQVATPFGYKSDLQFATFVDWKAHGRLESKNIYYRHIVGDCYEIRLSYNQDLKQINMSVDLLAFPSRAANFGIGQAGSLNSIIPQNFATNQFYGP